MKKVFLLFVIILSICLNTGCKLFFDKKDVDIEDISDNFVEGYVTENQTFLQTEHFIIDIDKNIYVPGYLTEYIEVLYDSVETVSNLNFYNNQYNSDKITIKVEKNYMSDSEFTKAFTDSKNMIVYIGAGDLLLGNSYTLIHELSHVIQYSQSYWDYNNIFVEGFAEYNSYKAVKYLEETNLQVAKMNESSKSQIANMQIDGDLYSKTIEYWIENPDETYDIAINGVYAVGMRFMNYLDNIYQDYTSWIKCYEEENPYYLDPFANPTLSLDTQKNIFIQKYGDEVFDEFYLWLKENESVLYANPFEEPISSYDLTELDYTYIYPYFNDNGDKIVMTRFYKFDYNNLYIVIDETRNYLEKYKGKDVSNMKLKLSKRVKVKLYDKNDRLIRTKFDNEFSLKGVSYIKLAGEGTLGETKKYGLKIVY